MKVQILPSQPEVTKRRHLRLRAYKMITFSPDPMHVALSVFMREYPQKNVLVSFSAELQEMGTVEEYEGKYHVKLNAYIPYAAVIGTLIHELAHIAGGSFLHGKTFKKALANLTDLYEKELSRQLLPEQALEYVDFDKILLPLVAANDEDA